MNKFKSLFIQLFMILCRPKLHLRYVIVLPLTNKVSSSSSMNHMIDLTATDDVESRMSTRVELSTTFPFDARADCLSCLHNLA